MCPVDDCEFSDLEVKQVNRVAREEFRRNSEWTVRDVSRRISHPNLIDVTIEEHGRPKGANNRTLVSRVPRRESCERERLD